MCVTASSAIVRDPFCVGIVSTTSNLFGDVSCITFRVPSPLELNTKLRTWIVAIGIDARMFDWINGLDMKKNLDKISK